MGTGAASPGGPHIQIRQSCTSKKAHNRCSQLAHICTSIDVCTYRRPVMRRTPIITQSCMCSH